MVRRMILKEAERLPHLPTDLSSAKDGEYVIKCTTKKIVKAHGAETRSKIWFQSPPLDIATIRRIDTLQLFAESHDQGYTSEGSTGNWTWFELVILENEQATSPRVVDGIELVWKSHDNGLGTPNYEWHDGYIDTTHDLLRMMEDGNIIAVRLCARFSGWIIDARAGILVIDIGHDTDQLAPPPYEEVVSQITSIQETIDEVNNKTNYLFKPSLPEDIFRADQFATRNERPLRVLALDGGGVRGLSSLRILDKIMKDTAPGKRPCEVFDMIGGTSTGGLIAIMLGRLKMTVDQCIEEYKALMSQVFDASYLGKYAKFAKNGFFYDASNLERIIKTLISKYAATPEEKANSADVPLLDDQNPCKVFVMTLLKDSANNRGPVFLRSYTNHLYEPLLPNIKLWQAARATSAAPAFFAPISVRHHESSEPDSLENPNPTYELIDGGLGANNPLGWLWTEVLGVFGPARRSDCFLSIGTGIPPNEDLPDIGLTGSHKVEKALASIATNTEIVHVLFRTLIDAFAPQTGSKKYWRFNVAQPINRYNETKGIWPFNTTVIHPEDFGKIGDMDDVAFAVNELEEMTKNYINSQKVTIDDCVSALKANLK